MSPNIKSQVGSSALSSTKPQAGEGFPSELHQQGLPESVEVSNSNYTELPNLNPIHTSLNGSKQWHDVNDNIAPLKNTGFPSSTTSEFDNEPLFVPETSTKSTQSSAMKKLVITIMIVQVLFLSRTDRLILITYHQHLPIPKSVMSRWI